MRVLEQGNLHHEKRQIHLILLSLVRWETKNNTPNDWCLLCILVFVRSSIPDRPTTINGTVCQDRAFSGLHPIPIKGSSPRYVSMHPAHPASVAYAKCVVHVLQLYPVFFPMSRLPEIALVCCIDGGTNGSNDWCPCLMRNYLQLKEH